MQITHEGMHLRVITNIFHIFDNLGKNKLINFRMVISNVKCNFLGCFKKIPPHPPAKTRSKTKFITLINDFEKNLVPKRANFKINSVFIKLTFKLFNATLVTTAAARCSAPKNLNEGNTFNKLHNTLHFRRTLKKNKPITIRNLL